MADEEGGGKKRRSPALQRKTDQSQQGTRQHRQPTEAGSAGLAAATAGAAAGELTPSAAYPSLSGAAWAIFGEALFASGASPSFLASIGLAPEESEGSADPSAAQQGAEQDANEEPAEPALTFPATVTDAAGYVFSVEGNGEAYVLAEIPAGAPGRLGARITPESAGWEELTIRWLDGATPIVAAVAEEGVAAGEVVDDDTTLEPEVARSWLDWGVDSLTSAVETADEIDKAVNPARWAGDALGKHLSNATNQAWDTVGRGVGSASDWWAGGKSPASKTASEAEQPAAISMEERFAAHQAGQGMLNTAIGKSEEDTNYTSGDEWLQTDAEGMLKRRMTSAEQSALFDGREGADDFVCSTFMIWTFLATQRATLPDTMSDEDKDEEMAKLLRAEIETTYEGDDARSGDYGHEFTWDKKRPGGGTREVTENLTFMAVGNTHLEAFKRGRDGESQVADDRVSDAFDDSKAAEGYTNDDLRVMGIAGALVLMGMADRVVDLNELRPGDVMQSRGKTLAGHATMVHRVWCQGSGFFGESPWFPTLLDSDTDLSTADPETGVWLEDVAFYIDQDTMPEFVGQYTQTAIDHIGAHNTGVESALSQADGEAQSTTARAGVFSRTTEGAATEHNSNSKRLYGGRLHDSPWQLPHTPATAPVLEETPAPAASTPQTKTDSGWGLW